MGKASNRKKAGQVLALSHKYGKVTIHSQSAPFSRSQADLVHDVFHAVESNNVALCQFFTDALENAGLSLFDFGFSEPSTHDGRKLSPLLLALLARSDAALEWLLDTLIAKKISFPTNFILIVGEWLDRCAQGTADRARLEMAFGKYAEFVACRMAEGVYECVAIEMLGVRAREMLADAGRRKMASIEQTMLGEVVQVFGKRAEAPKVKRL